MAKVIPTAVLDLPLNEIATGERITILSGEPANFAAIAALTLAEGELTPGAGNGDFTLGAGDVSGRKLTVSQQDSLDISDDGDATHLAIDDGVNLLVVTTCTTQTLTQGGTVTVAAWDVEFRAPV